MTIYIADYLLILTCIALILYISNQFIKLSDAIHILIVTRRVRQITAHRGMPPPPAATPMHPTSESGEAAEQPVWKPKQRTTAERANMFDKIESMQFNWWMIIGGTIALIIFGGMYYILGIYDPSGER